MRINEASKAIIGVVILLYGIALLTGVLSSYYLNKRGQALENRYEVLKAMDMLADGSDILTRLVRAYAATGDRQYKDDFEAEVRVIRSRDRAVERLSTLEVMPEELRLIELAKDNSDELINLEKQAIAAVEGGDKSTAIEIVYGMQYATAKFKIMTPIEDARIAMEHRLSMTVRDMTEKAHWSYWISLAAFALNVTMTVAALLLFYQKRVVKTLVALTNDTLRLLAGDKSVRFSTDTGAAEIDEMARALDDYRLVTEEMARVRWLREGTAEIVSRLQESESTESFGMALTGVLTPLLGGGYGAFFLDSGQGFTFTGGYGLSAKHVSRTLISGQDLADQAVRGGNPCFSDQVPEDYIKAAKALGEPEPRHLAAIPISGKDSVVAVVELATWKPLDELQVRLLWEMAEMVAPRLGILLRNVKTRELLQRFRTQAESLEVSERELKVRKEELEALNARLARRTESLSIAEARSRLLLASVDSGILGIDTEGGVIFANPAAIRLLGYDLEEMLGQPAEELLYGACPEEKKRTLGDVCNLLEEDCLESPDCALLWRKDGNSFLAEQHMTPMIHEGRETGSVLVFRDVSQRKLIERQIKAAREELLLIFDNSHVGIMFMYGDCMLGRANRRMADILGYPEPRDLVGRSMEALHRDLDSFQDFKQRHHEVFGKGEQSYCEKLLRRRDGSEVWCSMSGKAVDSSIPPDLEKGVIWVMDDISARKEMEDSLRKSEENFRIIADYTYDWEGWHDAHGALLWVNPAVERLTGYSVEQCMSMQDYPLPMVHPDDRHVFTTLRESVLAGEVGSDVIFRIVHKSLDDNKWATVSWNPVYDESGAITGYRTSVRDFSERRKAEEMTRLLLESAAEGIFGVDRRGHLLFINSMACSMLGVDAGEIIGLDIHELCHHSYPDGTSYPHEKCPMHRSINLGETFDILDEMFWRPDGTTFPVEYKSAPVVQDGVITGSVVTFRDITEQNKTRQRLLFTQRSVDIATDSIMWIEPLTGRLIYVNTTMCQRLGYEKEELLGRAMYEIDPEFIPDMLPMMLEQLEAGRDTSYESRHRTRSGRMIDMEVSMFLVEQDEHRIIVANARDITESLSVKRVLEEKERFMRSVIDNSGAFIYVKDLDGFYVLVNRDFSENLGLGAGFDPLGTTDTDIFGLEFSRAMREHDKHVVEVMGPVVTEEIMPISGEPRFFHVVKFPLFDADNEIYAVCGISSDITDRKRMEEEILEAQKAAEEATRAKSDFLARMSHEIRTPMNAIIGMSHLALQTELSPKQYDYLSKIQNASNSLLGIINDILDFSKIEAGKMDIESIPFRLDETMDNLANVILIKAEEKDLEVLFDVESDVPMELVGDPLRLGQILVNLCNNAIKFTDSGEIVVSASVESETPDEAVLLFSVKDSGIGLTKEQMGRLFQSFSQADGSTTRKYGGTGLGLAICKRLSEIMGGAHLGGERIRQWRDLLLYRDPGQGRRARAKLHTCGGPPGHARSGGG